MMSLRTQAYANCHLQRYNFTRFYFANCYRHLTTLLQKTYSSERVCRGHQFVGMVMNNCMRIRCKIKFIQNAERSVAKSAVRTLGPRA